MKHLKIVLLTSNSIRHKFVANSLKKDNEVLVISESRKSTTLNDKDSSTKINAHFNQRNNTEKEIFADNDDFHTEFVSIDYGQVNTSEIFKRVKLFDPHLIIAFGSSIIKEPLLSLLPKGHFLNVHLGIAPYYRGSGTNFWPFVNNELEYVGSTILHIDPGIDTGDIITHVTPKIELGDDVHKLGCKVIQESVITLQKIIDIVKDGKELPRTKQWVVDNEKYYKNKDFNEPILLKYKDNLKTGIVEKFLRSPKSIPKLINI